MDVFMAWIVVISLMCTYLQPHQVIHIKYV